MTAPESGWLKLKVIDPLVDTSRLRGPMQATPGTVHFPVRRGPMSTSRSGHAHNMDLMRGKTDSGTSEKSYPFPFISPTLGHIIFIWNREYVC